jgi:pilus assembly protein CpaC
VQSRVESENHGLPWISEVPYLGVAFRKVHESVNEVELLILVTPELVEAMDANEVPPCGPGMQTTSPSDWELFMKGYIEVPKCVPAAGNGECQQHGEDPNATPPDGLILGPGEKVPTPQPTDAVRRPLRNDHNAVAQGQSSDGSKSAGSYSRYSPSKPNSPQAAPATGSPKDPPGLIGPVGYDVVK